ncbi:unnamed protein product [Brassica oleracea var. botrytis]|uniref:F-box domain-containing protein n=3 Tax=Brassica TaxID=3705 RepID=A0A0D3BSX7_BRAOL|nr:unnamed protein product [Brassica napus]CDY34519.1 BnaC04g12800D [Brassica napus]VDD07097.1 unnamed protein product [Brassica oleracea]
MEATVTFEGDMFKLTTDNFSYWKPMMEDHFYCKDLHEPIIIKDKPEGKDDKAWEILNRKAVAVIRLMKKQAFPSTMTSWGLNVSESPQTIRRRRSSRLSAIDELLRKLPIDLIIEIFSRLPSKSIARCRCVSKWWASVLLRPDFTELFFTKSLARPQLLFARQKEGENEAIFFSSPQPNNPHHDSSPIVTAIRHKRKWEPDMRTFLGYDPVEKQHKVLAMIRQDDRVAEHQASNMVACFDVRSEKYNFVKLMGREMLDATLINFQGKLASVRTPMRYCLSETCTSFEMWILEDPEKHEWSKRIFNLPPMWKDIVVAGEKLYFVGVTATNEFVFSVDFPSDIVHVYCYNFVKEAITRVEIQGMGMFKRCSKLFTFLNHVEDVKVI